MADPFDSAASGDDFDRELADAARRFTAAVAAPDVWSQVLARTQTPIRPRRSYRNPVAAAIVLMIALASVSLVGGDDEPVSLTVAGQAGDAPTATSRTGDGCSQDLVAELRSGMAPELRTGASSSPEQLSLTSARVLRGEIVGAEPSDGGSFLLYKLENGPGAEALANSSGLRAAFWTDGSPDADFRASFVAFLTAEPITHMTGDYAAPPIHFDGLWVACDTKTAAASFNGAPMGGGWAEHLAGGLTLDELWELAAFPYGVFEQEIVGVPMQHEANVFDVRLLTGDRLRLAIARDLGGSLTVKERRDPLSILLELDGASAELFFDHCDGGVLGPNGALVEFVEDRLTLCRPDEGIRLEVASGDGARLPMNGWDVAPMGLGARLAPYLQSDDAAARCRNCTTFGPLRFEAAEIGVGGATDDSRSLSGAGTDRPVADDVIVYRPWSSRVIGYAADDLAYRWTANFDPSHVAIRTLDALVLVDIHDGPLVALDPADGSEMWRVEREVGEGDLVVQQVGDSALVLTSVDREGYEDRAPVIRRVDPATGKVLWTAEGGAGRRWGIDLLPVVVDDVVFVYDYPTSLSGSPAAGGPAELHGFDLESGAAQWTQSFAGRGEPSTDPWLDWFEVDSGKIVLFRTEHGVMHRVDSNGRQLWAVDPGAATVDGTAFAADGSLVISLAGTHGQVLLDPATGWPVRSGDRRGCVALVGANPWLTLFDDRRPGCVIVGDFQQIRIFNKGFDATTVDWVDGPVELRSDEYYDTDLVQWTLPAGMTSFDGSPYPIDDIWRMPRSASPTARFSVDGDSFGPAEVGMSVSQAAGALGVEVIVDDSLFDCPLGRVAQDPYSPLFVLDDSTAGDDPTISAIVAATDWPDAAATTLC